LLQGVYSRYGTVVTPAFQVVAERGGTRGFGGGFIRTVRKGKAEGHLFKRSGKSGGRRRGVHGVYAAHDKGAHFSGFHGFYQSGKSGIIALAEVVEAVQFQGGAKITQQVVDGQANGFRLF